MWGDGLVMGCPAGANHESIQCLGSSRTPLRYGHRMAPSTDNLLLTTDNHFQLPANSKADYYYHLRCLDNNLRQQSDSILNLLPCRAMKRRKDESTSSSVAKVASEAPSATYRGNEDEHPRNPNEGAIFGCRRDQATPTPPPAH